MQQAQARDEPEIGASFRRAGDAVDCYRIWMDGPILWVDAKGHWDMEVAEAYCSAVKRIVAELRLFRPHLRAIVDRSDGVQFEAGVAECLATDFRPIVRDGDRIAIVVDSSLAKGRARQLADREETQTFLSTSTARTWVLAYG